MAKMIKTKIRKNKQYLNFVEWMAQPAVLRQPKKLQDFSKVFGISKDTLTNWKNQTSFWQDVHVEVINLIRCEHLNGAIQALYKNILQNGRAAEVKLMFQLAGEWDNNENIIISTAKHGELSVERKKEILEKIRKWKHNSLK